MSASSHLQFLGEHVKTFGQEQYLSAQEIADMFDHHGLGPRMSASEVSDLLHELDWGDSEKNPPPARLRDHHGHRYWNKRLIETLITAMKNVDKREET